MNQLKLCKLFAELEGVETIEHRGELYRIDPKGDLSINSVAYGKYDPLGGELNCAARDKYKAEVSYSTFPCGRVLIECSWGNEISHFESMKELNQAVIVAILKSEGKL
jgi:hypothetical protein